jgi:hypothetical protein
MRPLAELLDLPDTTIALVGATDDPNKYGSIIYRNLRQRGYQIYPVNPRRQTVAGDAAYASLDRLPVRPTLVCLVVPPAVGLEIIEQCAQLRLPNIWLQPGAEDASLLARLEALRCNYSAGACIMVLGRRRAVQRYDGPGL